MHSLWDEVGFYTLKLHKKIYPCVRVDFFTVEVNFLSMD
jgi:hypothetical protein